jgi:hypothetical protein
MSIAAKKGTVPYLNVKAIGWPVCRVPGTVMYAKRKKMKNLQRNNALPTSKNTLFLRIKKGQKTVLLPEDLGQL